MFIEQPMQAVCSGIVFCRRTCLPGHLTQYVLLSQNVASNYTDQANASSKVYITSSIVMNNPANRISLRLIHTF